MRIKLKPYSFEEVCDAITLAGFIQAHTTADTNHDTVRGFYNQLDELYRQIPGLESHQGDVSIYQTKKVDVVMERFKPKVPVHLVTIDLRNSTKPAESVAIRHYAFTMKTDRLDRQYIERIVVLTTDQVETITA